MKKLLILGMTLLMMSSCVKHAQVYLLLSEEEAAAIPYQMGQTVKFLNQNGDTVTYEVTRDVTYPYNDEQYINAINGGDVSHLERYNYSCYARTVILTTDGQPYNNRFCFTIRPEKDFTFSFRFGDQEFDLEGSLYTNSPCSINGDNYESVHHQILYSQYTGELIYDWYYNEDLGLLYFQKGDFSLTRVP